MNLLLTFLAAVCALAGLLSLLSGRIPDDAMLAFPLPTGAARRRLVPLGVVLVLLAGGLGVAARFSPSRMAQAETPPSATVTTPTVSASPSALPTIALIGTVTPRPPTFTPSPTRGTSAPLQAAQLSTPAPP